MKLRYAMVCSSNQNRSMEAHSILKHHGFDVSSYGTGAHVKLPGPSIREPNVYDFGTPYKQMYEDLRRKDPDLYRRNGILPMLKRNSSVKAAPQRWQDNASDGAFDVVFAFEEKVFDMILEDLNTREHALMKSVLVINLDVKDNHEEAAVGARLAFDICQKLEAAESWEDAIDDIVAAFEREHRRKLLRNIAVFLYGVFDVDKSRSSPDCPHGLISDSCSNLQRFQTGFYGCKVQTGSNIPTNLVSDEHISENFGLFGPVDPKGYYI